MSLINEALKKAQREREQPGDAPAKRDLPKIGGSQPRPGNPAAAPGFKFMRVFIGGTALLALLAGAIGLLVTLLKKEPIPAPEPPSEVAVHIKTEAASVPAPPALPTESPRARLTETAPIARMSEPAAPEPVAPVVMPKTTTTPIPVSPPAVPTPPVVEPAKVSVAAVTPPEPVVTVPAPAPIPAPSTTVAPPPATVPASPAIAPTAAPVATVTPPATPSPSETLTPPEPAPVIVPAEPMAIATEEHPAPAPMPQQPVSTGEPEPESIPTPAPVAAAQPPNPQVIAFLEASRITGIKVAGSKSRVLMNNQVFKVGSIVEASTRLAITAIETNEIQFVDGSGIEYRKQFQR